MTKKFSAVLVVALLTLTAFLHADEKNPKIGFVDVKAIATRSNSIQSQVKSAEDKLRLKQEELEIHIRDYRNARRDLDAQKSVLSDDETRKRESKVEELRDKIDVMQLEIDKELRRTETDVMGPAVDRIIEAVQTVGREGGYDIIFTKDIVIYGRESYDLTPLVIDRLDKGEATKKK